MLRILVLHQRYLSRADAKCRFTEFFTRRCQVSLHALAIDNVLAVENSGPVCNDCDSNPNDHQYAKSDEGVYHLFGHPLVVCFVLIVSCIA